MSDQMDQLMPITSDQATTTSASEQIQQTRHTGSVERSALQKFHIHRFEIKYVLVPAQYQAIQNELARYLEHDPYSQRQPDRHYVVSSLYFDDPEYRHYWENVDSAGNRKKYRIRTYTTNRLEQSHVFCEIKRRRNAVIVKDRAKIRTEDYEALLAVNGGLGVAMPTLVADQQKTLDEIMFSILRFRMSPTVLVRYRREAFFSRDHNQLRVTLDRDIRSYHTQSLFPDSELFQAVLPGHTVLEIKFRGSLPRWVHRLIQRHDLHRVSCSKYCHSIQSTNGWSAALAI